MYVYIIVTPYNSSQNNCVIANSMGEAEKLFLKVYPNTTILEIKLYSKYVIVGESE